MDRMQQKQISTEICGSKVQHGSCPVTKAGAGLPPQLTVQEPPSFGAAGVVKKTPELNGVQAAVAHIEFTDQLQSDQLKSVSTPATLASISRPRPTALRTKPAPKMTRNLADPSKEIHLIPVCIPGPQSTIVPPHSQTESSLSLNSPQSPHSPQSSTSQPYLIPNPSLSPQPGLSPQPKRTTSPGSSTQSGNPGENNGFR